MKLKSTLLFAVILTISTIVFGQKAEPAKTEAAKLPTVQEILAKYVKAIGGREASEKIKTRVTKGTVEMSPMGIKGTFESYTAALDKSSTKMNLAGIGDFLDGFDGKSAWTSNPIQGSREKSGAELTQVKLMNNFYREINLDKLYVKLEVKGIEKIGDKDAYIVVATAEGLAAETLHFDTKSGLLLRSDITMLSPEGSQNAKIFYEDIRQIDGVMLPFKVRIILPQFEITMLATEVKNGVVIDESVFAKPKQ